MYFNDINLGFYILIAVAGLFIGELVNLMNKRLPVYEKIFTKNSFKEHFKEFNPNYILMIINAALYVAILYKFGVKETFIENLDLIKYLILVPMLLSTFVIDYKLQIIPNRLSLTMFEVGIVFTFFYGLSNVAISINMLLGMLVGGGIFLAITLLGALVYGKEAMGLGDVKLMGALGLYFGLTNIIIISIVSFFLAGFFIIFYVITKRKLIEYMAFGPFIVIASFIMVFVPYNIMINILLNVCSLGLYSKNKTI